MLPSTFADESQLGIANHSVPSTLYFGEYISIPTGIVLTKMNPNPHTKAIEQDLQLAALVGAHGNEFQALSRGQVEKLVFYLKAIHDYYPNSENHVSFWTDFSNKLDAIRESVEQRTLQRQASQGLLLGMAACLIAGVVLSPALGPIRSLVASLGLVIQVVLGAALVFIADVYCFKRALLVSKEQDRRYFLASVRAARACNELDWAGLFTYNAAAKAGPQSDADLERTAEAVAALTTSLRAALYNDEFFQYSSKELSRSGPGDA